MAYSKVRIVKQYHKIADSELLGLITAVGVIDIYSKQCACREEFLLDSLNEETEF